MKKYFLIGMLFTYFNTYPMGLSVARQRVLSSLSAVANRGRMLATQTTFNQNDSNEVGDFLTGPNFMIGGATTMVSPAIMLGASFLTDQQYLMFCSPLVVSAMVGYNKAKTNNVKEIRAVIPSLKTSSFFTLGSASLVMINSGFIFGTFGMIGAVWGGSSVMSSLGMMARAAKESQNS